MPRYTKAVHFNKIILPEDIETVLLSKHPILHTRQKQNQKDSNSAINCFKKKRISQISFLASSHAKDHFYKFALAFDAMD